MSREGIPTSVSRVGLSHPLPEEWDEAGVVEKIFIYPLKSARGHEVEAAEATLNGLKCKNLIDRQFMIINGHNGAFITARQFPKIVLIQVSIDDRQITLSGPGVESITVTIPDPSSLNEPKLTSKVWNQWCKGYCLSDEADQWISRYIRHHHGSGYGATSDDQESSRFFRIIFHPPEEVTPDRQNYPESDPLAPMTRPRDVPIFADDYPVNLQTKPSLANLNQRLKAHNINMTIGERQFRPNILVSGDFAAFSEDQWVFIRINDVLFRNARLCARCIFTTIDPETGEKSSTGEPLKVLKSFRSVTNESERKVVGDAPFYGIHLGIDQVGRIRTGDKIFVGRVPNQKADSKIFYSVYVGVCALLTAKILMNWFSAK